MSTNQQNYGIQPDGSFNRKHIDVIIADLEDAARQEFGQDVDLSQGSPVKQMIDMVAQEVARQWETLEAVYYAAYYEDAFGEQLDSILSLAGVSRKERRGATGEVEFSTDTVNAVDVPIPEGTEVRTASTDSRPQIPFETTEPVDLDAGESSVLVEVEALEPTQTDVGEEWLGEETNVPSNTITQLPNPISGIDSVTNPKATGDGDDSYVEGRDRETDAEFKLRYENIVGGAGLATIDAIESEIFNSDPDVKSVKVAERRNESAGEYGIEVTVLAPNVADTTIAQAILDSRAGGVNTYGSKSAVAELDDGTQKTEFFSEATGVPILVDVDIDDTTNTYPDDGDEQIRDKIIRYIGGVDSTNVRYPGTEIGVSVVYDQVFKRVMEVQGVISATVYIGEDAPETEQGTDPDDATVSTSAARGVRVEATADKETFYIESQLSANTADATRARLLDTGGNTLESVDISSVSAGEWFRFDKIQDVSSGDEFDIAVDAEGSSYTSGEDADPTYPYDGASAAFKITQRYIDGSDGTPQATRPGVSAVRTNDLGVSDISIGSNKAAETQEEDVDVVS